MEVTLGPVTAVPPGEGRNFQIGSQAVAVFRSRKGELFATQATCPHRQGPLADGLVGDGTLICPLHSMRFDLRSGQAQNGECRIRTYCARQSDAGQILIEMSEGT